MSTLSEIEVRKIKDATVREVISRLTQGAVDASRIGRRVLVWDFKLRRAGEGEKLKCLAARLNVSSARMSQAVADVEAHLFEIRNINSPGQQK
jgi:hypothetical protein